MKNALYAIDYDTVKKVVVAVGDGEESLFSSDSGYTWVENTPVSNFWALSCLSSYGGISMTASVGLNPGHVLMTKDFGDSWTDQWIQKDIPILGCDVKGWTLVGTGGSIYHSIDKGMNWNSVPSGTLLNLNA